MVFRRFALIAALVLAALSNATPAASDDAVKPAVPAGATSYVVLFGGTPAGSMTVARDGASERIAFEFTDRGRGPKTDEILETGADGVPTKIRITGVNYLKAPVDETFARDGAQATWSNAGEHGSRPLAEPAFYVGMDGAPEETAVLARALLRRTDRTLPLLPAGTAVLSKIAERDVDGTTGSVHVTCYGISGLGFEPQPVWLRDDGTLFASVSGVFDIVPSGYEKTAAPLLATQDEAAVAAARTTAHALAHVPAGPVAFIHAAVFDSRTATIESGMTVVVEGAKITKMGETMTTTVPAGARVIDAIGQTLIPGMWDMHHHVQPIGGVLNLAAGVTTVRDLGNDNATLLKTVAQYDAGDRIGPHVVRAGLIEGRGPFAIGLGTKASTRAEVLRAVDDYASKGYEQIKLYSSFDPALVPIAAAEAHRKGLRVSGHVPQGMLAEEAVRAGYDEIQHVNFLLLNFLPDIKDQTASTMRFIGPAKDAGAIDLDSPQVKAFIELLRTHRTVCDVTVSIFEDQWTQRPGAPSAAFAPVVDRLPPQVARGFLTSGLPVPDGMDARYRAAFTTALGLVKRLYDAGVPIVAGTDDLEGFTLDRELENYVRAGIPAPQVMRMATYGAAHVMRHDDRSGVIAPGYDADIVILDGDPTMNISAVRNVALVMKSGTIYDPDELDRAVGITPRRH